MFLPKRTVLIEAGDVTQISPFQYETSNSATNPIVRIKDFKLLYQSSRFMTSSDRDPRGAPFVKMHHHDLYLDSFSTFGLLLL
jgi:hypothetical protein